MSAASDWQEMEEQYFQPEHTVPVDFLRKIVVGKVWNRAAPRTVKLLHCFGS